MRRLLAVLLFAIPLFADQNEVNALYAKGVRGAELDRACNQKDCEWSRLYWHTDLEAAKRDAKLHARPILSLRLLGRLDEELSCANSRFFRTILYSHPEIATYLRNDFTLHWQSVRPVPVITIDFGDGGRMQRTITGNSIHYVLDHEGKPLDAIPGMYSPAAFLAVLVDAHALYRYEPKALREYHASAAGSARDAEKRDLQESRLANSAALRAMTKSAMAEATMLDRIAFDMRRPRVIEQTNAQLEMVEVRDPALDMFEATLHPDSIALIKAKRASVPDAAIRNAPLEPMLARLQKALLADTRRNEYDLHPRIHEWFAKGEVKDVDSLNARVYDELFLTPPDDVWMGLADEASFTGIDGEGLTAAASASRSRGQ